MLRVPTGGALTFRNSPARQAESTSCLVQSPVDGDMTTLSRVPSFDGLVEPRLMLKKELRGGLWADGNGTSRGDLRPNWLGGNVIASTAGVGFAPYLIANR